MLRLALFGDPVGHSLSPVIQAAALEAAGLSGTYESRRVDGDGMAHAVDQLRAGHLDGANVTMPHKQLAATLSDELSEDASRAGAVNTLVARDGLVHGETTDVAAVRSLLGRLPAGPVLLLGAGGAAAAALLACEGRAIQIAARRASAAMALVKALTVRASIVDWGTPVPDVLLINATPLGMQGESLPDGLVEVAHGLLDMAYGPEVTPAVSTAEASGVAVVDGRQMLVEQATKSFQIWTGVAASTEAMMSALS